LKAIRLFRFVTRKQLEVYFRGQQRRIKALEKTLPVLEREDRVKTTWHKGEKVYSPIGRLQPERVFIDHELAATEILIAIWRCRMDEGEIVTESAFRGFAVVADGGVRYSSKRGTMVAFEYCTRKNFNHGGVVKSKLTRYKRFLPDLEKHFQRSITVLFVIEDSRMRVAEFVSRNRKILDQPVISAIMDAERYPFFFTDHETFKNAPVGRILNQEIFFWVDGKEWRLSND
jgi:hypothetical protein